MQSQFFISTPTSGSYYYANYSLLSIMGITTCPTRISPSDASHAIQRPNVGPPCTPSPYSIGRYPTSISLGISASSRCPMKGCTLGMTQRAVEPSFLKPTLVGVATLNPAHVSSSYGSVPLSTMLGRNL